MLRNMKFRTTVASVGALSLVTVTALSATAFVSGGFDFGNIYSSGGISDIFGGDNVGGVFGDIFGGEGSGSIGDILGGVLGENGSFGNGCVNIVQSSNCGGGGGGVDLGGIAGSILNGDTDGIFDVVLDEVGGELGIPSDIMSVIKGDSSFEDLLGGLFNDILKDAGLDGGNTGVFGSQGLPDIFATQDALNGIGGNPRDAVATIGIADPGLISTLKNSVIATAPMTRITAEKVIGETGQNLTTARNAAADAAVKTSSSMTNGSVKAVVRNKTATGTLNGEIDGKQSTQDVLKTAFAGLNQLNAERDGMTMMQIQQAGLTNTLGQLQLGVLNSTSESSAVTSVQLQNVNEQLLRANQQDLLKDITVAENAASATLGFGAMR